MISVIVPVYNRKDSLLLLLEDLTRQEGTQYEVIVIDDKSTDDTVECVINRFPQVTVLKNEQNSGPCVSRNRGVRAAKGEIIVGFDSDVTLPDSTLLFRIQQAFDSESEVHGFAFRILDTDGKTDDVPRWWHPLPIDKFANRRFETSYFSGTAYAFRRQEMVEAGIFPEILFMYYEEVELALRIIDGGGCIMYSPDFIVHHHPGITQGRSSRRVFFNPRNQILLALGCFTWLRATWYLSSRLFAGFLKSLKLGQVKTFFRGLRAGVELVPRRLRDRCPLKSETWNRLAHMRRLPCSH